MFEFKKLAFVVPLLVVFSNTGSFNYFHQFNRTRKSTVTINTFGQFGSNSFTTEFAHSFLTGQYLSSAIKDPVRNKLGDYNRAGFDWTTEISYMNLNDTMLGRNWGYYLGLKNRIYADSRYSSDLFVVPFYGNAGYTNSTARMGGSNADLVMYQQFQVGFTKQFLSDHTAHTIGFGVSFINGNMRYTADIATANLFTSADGSAMDLEASMMLQRTDMSRMGFFANNGSGLSMDLFYEANLGERGTFDLSVNDFGFINWDRPGDRMTIDTALHFEGVQVGNLFETDGSEFNEFLDTLQRAAKTSTERYGLMMLPLNVSISYSHLFKGDRIMLQGGAQFRAMSSFLPLIYVRGIFYPHKHVMLGAMVGYGGFSTLNVGFDLGFDFGKGWIIQLTTRNLEGVVPNSFGTGLSAGFKFSKMF